LLSSLKKQKNIF